MFSYSVGDYVTVRDQNGILRVVRIESFADHEKTILVREILSGHHFYIFPRDICY